MILYIHGFRTTYDSYIAKILKTSFGDELISSDHSHDPKIAIKEFEDIIDKHQITGIIASSLGGYYATYLSNKYNLKTLLINPSVEPHITTKKYIGTIEKFDGTTFEWTQEHTKELGNIWVENLDYSNFYLFLKTGDKILDYKISKKRYFKSKMLIKDGGDHRFSDLEKYIKEIKLFLE